LPVFGNKFPFSFHGTFCGVGAVLAGFDGQWRDLKIARPDFGIVKMSRLQNVVITLLPESHLSGRLKTITMPPDS
jgi:hypothetical protein